jgi:hypothetical protein
MNENQTRITDLLMQVTHRCKYPDTYGNKELEGLVEPMRKSDINRRKH